MEQVFGYIIALGASVMMPIIFTIIGMCIGMKFGKALKSGLHKYGLKQSGRSRIRRFRCSHRPADNKL